MTTKQQERDALAKIRKIVESLGDESYIGTAFKGVFNSAETNIEWDAAFSIAEELDIAREEAKAAKSEAETLRNENKKLAECNEAATVSMERVQKELQDSLDNIREQWNARRAAEDALEAARAEITTLKAKLYDLMTAEA